jgi:hypothetical protein
MGKCPNVSRHCLDTKSNGHAIDVEALASLVQTLLEEDSDQIREPLGKQGARGTLFDITLASHGYTLYQTCQQIFGDEVEDTFDNLALLALVLQHQGKYEAAEEMNRQGLAGRGEALGVKHPLTLTSVSNLVSVFQYKGKYEAAEERRFYFLLSDILGFQNSF